MTAEDSDKKPKSRIGKMKKVSFRKIIKNLLGGESNDADGQHVTGIYAGAQASQQCSRGHLIADDRFFAESLRSRRIRRIPAGSEVFIEAIEELHILRGDFKAVRGTLLVIRAPLNDLNGVWFDRLTMHGLFSAHPELVEGLNGLNVLNVQSFADMPKKAQWRKNLAAAR
jgi:hypothetical protein